MCNRNRLPGSYWLCLLLTLLFCLAAIARADEPSGQSGQSTPPPLPPSSQSSPTPGTIPTDPWQSFDSAWLNLKDELTGSQTDSEAQLTLLQGLQTEVNGLRSLSQESTRRYEESEASRMTERQEAVEREAGIVERLWAEERAATLWRSVAAVFGAVAVVELVLLLVR